jgi:hypothetical protein
MSHEETSDGSPGEGPESCMVAARVHALVGRHDSLHDSLVEEQPRWDLTNRLAVICGHRLEVAEPAELEIRRHSIDISALGGKAELRVERDGQSPYAATLRLGRRSLSGECVVHNHPVQP